jgi:hypothetical protein
MEPAALTPDYCVSEASRQDRLAIEVRRSGDFRKAEEHERRACLLRHQAKGEAAFQNGEDKSAAVHFRRARASNEEGFGLDGRGR